MKIIGKIVRITLEIGWIAAAMQREVEVFKTEQSSIHHRFESEKLTNPTPQGENLLLTG